MKEILMNKDWQCMLQAARNDEPNSPVTVTLPHDAMIAQKRDDTLFNGRDKGFFPGGVWEYTKTFYIPEEYRDKHIVFRFEGVYARPTVYINGIFAGQNAFGYTEFYVEADPYLKFGTDNIIKVIVRTADDSRWYTGAGIYRDVVMLVSELVHIKPDGVRVSTPDINNKRAVVQVETDICNLSANAISTLQLITELYLNETLVAKDTAPVSVYRGESVTHRQRLFVLSPKLWDVDNPVLYTCKTTLKEGDKVLDTHETTFGIRSLALDNVDGLQMNGKTLKLRGACIHHDNGVIGAATLQSAEERRVRILKEAGFNAIRSAHHPAGRALLKACDKLGMLVMDEAFDIWTNEKTPWDYAIDFPKWWEQDIEAMVRKDYNHPSVILYSIGNEITETGNSHGTNWSRKLVSKIRSLDDTRFIINCINGLLSAHGQILTQHSKVKELEQNSHTSRKQDINEMMANVGERMWQAAQLPIIGQVTAESFACVDIAGYNYMAGRYEMDKELYPNRIICGSETFARDIDRNWRLVMDNGHVIGDFTWTGWDYLGETGIGRIDYTDTKRQNYAFYANYPWITAWAGDIDITGHRRPASYYREIVFGLRKDPYIAVQRPEFYGKDPIPSPWSWSNSVSGWTWQGYEGKPIRVEVYSDADEVELLLNGKSLGSAPAGEANRFKAEFDIIYQPGKLKAVAYKDGKEQGRYSLTSAEGEIKLVATPDKTHIRNCEHEAVFVEICLTDKDGNLYHSADRAVSIKVEGAGMLMGFGSADPKSEENFFDTTRTTFDGRALAVIRPVKEGTIHVVVESQGCEGCEFDIIVQSSE